MRTAFAKVDNAKSWVSGRSSASTSATTTKNAKIATSADCFRMRIVRVRAENAMLGAWLRQMENSVCFYSNMNLEYM